MTINKKILRETSYKPFVFKPTVLYFCWDKEENNFLWTNHFYYISASSGIQPLIIDEKIAEKVVEKRIFEITKSFDRFGMLLKENSRFHYGLEGKEPLVKYEIIEIEDDQEFFTMDGKDLTKDYFGR